MAKSRLKKVPQSARLSAGGGCNCYLGNAQIEVETSRKGLPLCPLFLHNCQSTTSPKCLPAAFFTAAGAYQMSMWALGKHRCLLTFIIPQ